MLTGSSLAGSALKVNIREHTSHELRVSTALKPRNNVAGNLR